MRVVSTALAVLLAVEGVFVMVMLLAAATYGMVALVKVGQW